MHPKIPAFCFLSLFIFSPRIFINQTFTVRLQRSHTQTYPLPRYSQWTAWHHGSGQSAGRWQVPGQCPDVYKRQVLGPILQFSSPAVAAVAGAPMPLTLNQKPVPMNTSFSIQPGDLLSFGGVSAGCRSYLAVKGGFAPVSYTHLSILYIFRYLLSLS